MLAQAALVNGADLLEQHDGVLRQADVPAGQLNVRRQLCLVHLARDRRRDHRGRMPVPHVVLHDEHGPRAPLLTADDRTEIGIENIATLDSHIHFRFTLREKYHPLH